MARPKSKDKREATLEAPTRLFAERGLTAAPTSEIAKRDGVAETKRAMLDLLFRPLNIAHYGDDVPDVHLPAPFIRGQKSRWWKS